MKFNKEFLRDCRKYNGYTQEELARLIGVTKQAVQKWEQGEAIPRMAKIKRLAEVLKTSLDNLVHLEVTKHDITTRVSGNNNSTSAIGDHNIFFNPEKAESIIADCRNKLISALIEADIDPVALKQVLQIINSIMGAKK